MSLMKLPQLSLRDLFWLVLVCAMAVGCANRPQRFNGEVKFANQSGRNLYVESVEGFESEPPCGALVAGRSASSSMHPMPRPERVVITWRSEGKVSTSTVSLSDLPSKGRNDKLVFEFTDDNTWAARFAPP